MVFNHRKIQNHWAEQSSCILKVRKMASHRNIRQRLKISYDQIISLLDMFWHGMFLTLKALHTSLTHLGLHSNYAGKIFWMLYNLHELWVISRNEDIHLGHWEIIWEYIIKAIFLKSLLGTETSCSKKSMMKKIKLPWLLFSHRW